jgi:hypothetical protein
LRAPGPYPGRLSRRVRCSAPRHKRHARPGPHPGSAAVVDTRWPATRMSVGGGGAASSPLRRASPGMTCAAITITAKARAGPPWQGHRLHHQIDAGSRGWLLLRVCTMIRPRVQRSGLTAADVSHGDGTGCGWLVTCTDAAGAGWVTRQGCAGCPASSVITPSPLSARTATTRPSGRAPVTASPDADRVPGGTDDGFSEWPNRA